MSLALVDILVTGRTSHMWLQKLCTFPPLFFLHCCLFFCLRRTWCMVLKRMYGYSERIRGKLANPGSSGRMAVKPVHMSMYIMSCIM